MMLVQIFAILVPTKVILLVKYSVLYCMARGRKSLCFADVSYGGHSLGVSRPYSRLVCRTRHGRVREPAWAPRSACHGSLI